MRISVLTLFPGMFTGVLQESILKRAIDRGLLQVQFYNVRDYADNKHRQVDDYPFGGGAGMVLMPQPALDCRGAAIATAHGPCKTIYLSPKGTPLTTEVAQRLAQEQELILLCGHYEGIDQRVLDTYVDEEISLGDFVLTGGEIAAMALIDCVSRLIPGVLGSADSLQDESFSAHLLEYPQYTRPSAFRGQCVPPVLLSGNHAEIEKWRREQSLRITKERRPDLLAKAHLTEEERKLYLTHDELVSP